MGKVTLNLGKKNQRSCEGCTACCEGWLTADIHGQIMEPGKPCQYVEKSVGCTIYKDRPKDPCKEFRCMWRDTDSQIMPEEFKPSESGSIVTRQVLGGIEYLDLVECGVKPLPEMISWFTTFAIGRGLNAHWTVDGKSFWIGSPEFNFKMSEKHYGKSSA